MDKATLQQRLQAVEPSACNDNVAPDERESVDDAAAAISLLAYWMQNSFD
jgi:hypothetical protein